MGDLFSLAREMTSLNEVQAKILDHMGPALQFAADVSRNQVFLCAPGNQSGTAAVLASRRPSYSVYPFFLQEGRMYQESEFTIVGDVFRAGKKVIGRKELELGRMAGMTCYPVVDNAGIPFAVFGLISRTPRQSQILMDTADLIIELPLEKNEYYALRPQDGLIIIDSVGRIIYANDAAAGLYLTLDKEMTDRHELLGHSLIHFPLVDQVMQTGRPAFGDEVKENTAISAWAIPLMASGRMKRAILILKDVTEIREKEKQILVKDSVIKEIHHRVKNSLAMIAGMLRMQARRSENETTQTELMRAVARISGISEIHDMLAHINGDSVELVSFLKKLSMININSLSPCQVALHVYGDKSVIMNSDKVISIAIAANELIHNALSHGFAGHKAGVLTIRVDEKNSRFRLSIHNTGNPLPPSFGVNGYDLGLQIVRTIAEIELRGTFTLSNDKNGVNAVITCPLEILKEN